MTDLKDISDAELHGEVARRRESERQEAIERGKRSAKLVVQHLDVLLALIPEHSQNSCGDLLLLNPDQGCTRCQLLTVKHDGLADFEIEALLLKRLPE